ncbi:MAG: ABC transporter ATP-binding protein [Candidatus Cloacimonetes bacterium]|nr:ABC transporter ATP-binding protein [Candidatus Cloacimonadota bacterium]
MSHLIEITNLSKTYLMGDFEVHALRGIDLTIDEGEFVAIMGASGSGKTTLMNLIGCLDKPTTGSYHLDGVPVHQIEEDGLAQIRNHQIGYVFQSFYLLPRTTAMENVELPLLYSKKLHAQDRHKRSLEALEVVSLKERAHHYPNQLSGGQQQRVAIARAIVNDPVFLLADEPTGNLDTRTSIEVMSVFQNLNREGKTVLLVTHESDIAQYAKRLITFRDGRIISDLQNNTQRDAVADLAKIPTLED